MTAQLLTPPKIVIRNVENLSHKELLTLLKSGKRKNKYGLVEIAFDVDQIDGDRYNVRIEYIAKDL